MSKRTRAILGGILGAASLFAAGQASAAPDDKPIVDLTPEGAVLVKQGDMAMRPHHDTGEYGIVQFGKNARAWLTDAGEQKAKLANTVKDMCDPRKQVPADMGPALKDLSKVDGASVGGKIQTFCKKVAQFNP